MKYTLSVLIFQNRDYRLYLFCTFWRNNVRHSVKSVTLIKNGFTLGSMLRYAIQLVLTMVRHDVSHHFKCNSGIYLLYFGHVF